MRLAEGQRAVPVVVDGRKFTVVFDPDGEAVRIVERAWYDHGKPWLSGWCNRTYWHHKHHTLGAMWTLPQRVLTAARDAS